MAVARNADRGARPPPSPRTTPSRWRRPRQTWRGMTGCGTATRKRGGRGGASDSYHKAAYPHRRPVGGGAAHPRIVKRRAECGRSCGRGTRDVFNALGPTECKASTPQSCPLTRGRGSRALEPPPGDAGAATPGAAPPSPPAAFTLHTQKHTALVDRALPIGVQVPTVNASVALMAPLQAVVPEYQVTFALPALSHNARRGPEAVSRHTFRGYVPTRPTTEQAVSVYSVTFTLRVGGGWGRRRHAWCATMRTRRG